ncbi:MAG: hypothetical protein ACI9XC_000715 [Gammaproteobacteria bacterium]|jgi:hypothetical protein
MSLTIIELNDSEIRTASDAEIISRDPGYAVLTTDQIKTGIDAWCVARTTPRETSNKFWSQLNQDPLINSSHLARHNADLAYNQLIAICEHAGNPEEILFAVPGSFNRDHLAMLLGIVEACPFSAIGLVDTAIASTSAFANVGHYNHLDIHLHYAIVTSVDVTDQVSRKSVKVIDNVGIAEIFDTAAEYFSDLFIDQSRFDPLHHAETEQTLYNQIPQCLSTLKSTNETSLEIEFKGKRYQAKVSTEALLERLIKHYEKIYRELSETRINLISDRLDILPGFSGALKNSQIIDEASVFTGCMINFDNIQSNDSALSLITSLPATNAPTRPTELREPMMDNSHHEMVQTKLPTHLLVDSQAFNLKNQPIYVSASGNIYISQDDSALFSIVLNSSSARISTVGDTTIYVNGNPVKGEEYINTGDCISIAGSEQIMNLIEVI